MNKDVIKKQRKYSAEEISLIVITCVVWIMAVITILATHFG